jgi:hypothetical protein
VKPPHPRAPVRALISLSAVAVAGLFLGFSLRVSASDRDAGADFRTLYRADGQGVIGDGVPREIELVLPEGAGAWPARARESLEQQIRREWAPVAGKLYGTLHAGVGIWLDSPLITARNGRRVRVPVVDGTRLPIRGALSPYRAEGPRRIVLLIDASSSANARAYFRGPDGNFEQVSVLEAERRALDRLVELLADDWLEFGLIAFGEGTWPIVEPGASIETVRERLQRFRQEHPRGEGRTDLVCALSLAREWLEYTPKGVSREIFLLTDGDLPHSGRFVDCSFARKRGGRQAEANCLALRNRTECPASRSSWSAGSRSDLVQLSAFARQARRDVAVYPLVFEPDRSARAYHQLAQQTGGEVVRVSSPQAIEVVLPSLVAGRIRGVFARNEGTGDETGDLLDSRTMRFRGELPLAPGANDIELRVESDRGTAALLRFRIYAAPRFLERFLAELRERNQSLEVRMAELADEGRKRERAILRRTLEVVPESVPASAGTP